MSSIALLLFLVLPVSVSTRVDATRPLPETHSVIFDLNAGQVSSEVKFLSPTDGLSAPDFLAANVGRIEI